MMSETKLFIKSFKHTFFCLENPTFRALPGVRDIFPCSAGWNSMFWISFQGVVYIVAFETHISGHCSCSGHSRFHSKNYCSILRNQYLCWPGLLFIYPIFLSFMFMKRTKNNLFIPENNCYHKKHYRITSLSCVYFIVSG